MVVIVATHAVETLFGNNWGRHLFDEYFTVSLPMFGGGTVGVSNKLFFFLS